MPGIMQPVEKLTRSTGHRAIFALHTVSVLPPPGLLSVIWPPVESMAAMSLSYLRYSSNFSLSFFFISLDQQGDARLILPLMQAEI